MSVVVSHPTGNANTRAVLRALEQRGWLAQFWTTLALPAAIADAPALSQRLRRELGRRVFPEVAWRRTRLRSRREAVRQLSPRFGLTHLTRHEHGWACVDAVYADLDRVVAGALTTRRDNLRAVYAYEDGARDTFRAAGRVGLARLYDLPIAHWRTLRRLLSEEAELLPEWAGTMEGLADGDAKLARKDEELALADRIVVASSFTRRSLCDHGMDGDKVTVTPYGAPPPCITAPATRGANEPLHVFYAGHLTQRKGMAYLVRALERLDVPWTLSLAGPAPQHCPAPLRRLLSDPRCRALGHVPHETLLDAMTGAHVFVFPSIVEGFGMVLYEAMAAGLPVVTTPHTAGPDILTHGYDGFIVPIRDPDAIATHLAALATDEDRRRAMAEAALATAATHGWASYEARVAAVVAEVLD